MMHMVRYHINFFGKSFKYQVLGYNTPYWVTEFIGVMGTIPVKPDSTMRTHHNHAVYYNGNYQRPGEIKEQKGKKEGQHTHYHYPTDHRDPVLLRFKYINPGESFGPQLFGGRYNQVAIFIFPAIRRRLEYVINKGHAVVGVFYRK
jgi:hypothetical protein